MGVIVSTRRTPRPGIALLVAGGLFAWTCALASIAVAIIMIGSVAGQGLAGIADFPTHVGVAVALAWSAGVVAAALPVATLVSFLASIAAAEDSLGDPLNVAVRAWLRIAPAVPSVLVGLAAAMVMTNAARTAWVFSHPLLAAAAVLCALHLPVMTSRFRSVLRAVPARWRVGAAAAGSDVWSSYRTVIVPRALPGIVAVVLNAAGQMLGETAAVAMLLAVSWPAAVVGEKPASMPLAVHIWLSLSGGARDARIVAMSAAELLALLAAIIVLRFAARLLLHRRRRAGAAA